MHTTGQGTLLAILLGGLCLLTGCRQQMAEQPSYKPLRPSGFFKDGMSARPPVPGTVARGQLQDSAPLYTGKNPAAVATIVPIDLRPPEGSASDVLARLGPSLDRKEIYVTAFPIAITERVMHRGQERFGIFCAVCHDGAGTGFGKIVERGFTRPPSFYEDRLRQAPVGYFFDVITNGYGSMPPYAAQVPTEDRWAIVAYIRALQLSRYTDLRELPDDLRRNFEEAKGP
jgi:mono/diheme cytochrome c family protein